MSEADVNISSLSQDLTSASPLCVEISGTISDLPQNEIKNVKGKNESNITLSEDIYNTIDSLIGDINIEKYSDSIPADSGISSFRQFEPVCKFHWTEAFNDETATFQNPTEGLYYTEKSKLQNHMSNYEEDSNTKKDLVEEKQVKIIISTKEDLLANKSVSKHSKSPPLIHYYGEKLAKNTAKGPAFISTQPQSSLYKQSDSEEPSSKENSFTLLELRTNYKTETTVPNEIQCSDKIPEASVNHQMESRVGVVESPRTFSTWSLADISWSYRESREDCKTSDTEQSFESLQPLEEDLDLSEVLQKLKHTNKKQQTRIQDLQCSNMYLEKKVKELQMKMIKQEMLVDIINKLKENVEKLIEDKYKVILEKNDTDKTLKNVQEILSNTQKHLQESQNEKKNLQLELKKIKMSYIHLQERCMAEIQQKSKSVSQCIKMDRNLSKKKEEVERLQKAKKELEMATASALDLLKREKEILGQKFLSFQKHEKQNLQESQKLKSSLDKLIAQVKSLQFISENERAKNVKLEQQINKVKSENAELQQQLTRSGEQNYVPKFEQAEVKEQLEDVMESAFVKETKMNHSSLLLNCSSCEEENLHPPDEKRTQLTSNVHNLLTLMVGLLTCQDITNPDAENFKEKNKNIDIMLQKLKCFHLKKKNLDKEATGFDSFDANKINDVPILLEAKLDKYHNLNEELDFLIAKLGHLLASKEDHCNRLVEQNDEFQRHLGNLIDKVTSYEEIIECADQRLQISHSQIAHLEERNKHLENLIRRPREKTRKLKPRRLENHPKSMTVIGHHNDHFKEYYITM
ncbi:cancer-associated gene 1 protein [Echinops telfairi]|uniref:Cancer-associated gene 1 protein n=1 Tax=Echinops telfairi TaxID=9371 RepID=A0AC55CUY5_ECHTE|nr:cancer-associated gene 1 protein [Echinops telfairi]